MGRMDGKVALITGAASGIGRASAAALVREGATVILTDYREESGELAARELGGRAHFLLQDVTSEDAWKSVIATIRARFGGLHVLVNNAGIGVAKRLEETTLEEWRFVQAVNVEGVFLGCKHALAPMRESGGGSIVNVSSIAGIVGVPDFPAYCASKGAVRLLSKSVALEGARGPVKVRCNSVHPTYTDTPMVRALARAGGDEEKGLERLRRAIPLGRLGTPDEVANAVLFLASDESSLVTGTELIVDGGATAM